MDPSFASLTDQLDFKYQALISMTPVIAENVADNTPKGGIYIFSENGVNLYVGRTKRKLCVRIRNHFSADPACPFAWSLAREATGYKRTYRREGSRGDLLTRSDFVAVYEAQKMRIRKMHVRYVEEANPLRQTLLEIYAAVVSGSKYNDFDCH